MSSLALCSYYTNLDISQMARISTVNQRVGHYSERVVWNVD